MMQVILAVTKTLEFGLNQSQDSAAVEHRTHNPEVEGSIPSPATITFSPKNNCNLQ